LHQFKNSFLVPDEDILWVLSSIFTARHLSRNADIVYASVPPFSTSILGYLAVWGRSAKLVLDVKDDWVEWNARQGKGRFVSRVEGALEQKIFSKASALLIPTERGVRQLRSRLPINTSSKLYLVPNGSDVSEFLDVQKAMDNRKHSGVFTVCCGVGGIGKGHRDISSFLHSLSRAIDNTPRMRQSLRVRFLGTNPYREYSDEIRKLSLESNIDFFQGLSRKDYIKHLTECDMLLLVQYDDTPSSVSGTIYEYWAAGRAPILLIGGKGATRETLERHELGCAFDSDDIDGIQRCLVTAFHAWENGRPWRLKPNSSVHAFDRRAIAQTFENILQNLTSRSISKKE